MRPSPPAQAPSKDPAKCQREESRIKRRRPLWRTADRVFAVDSPDGPAEQLIGSLRIALESLRDDPYERDSWAERVAKWRPAAVCVPPIEASWRETQPDDALLALNEREACWRDLHNVGTSVGIEKVRATKMVEEGLAVVAVADGAVHSARRDVSAHPANSSATTAQRRVFAHLLCDPR